MVSLVLTIAQFNALACDALNTYERQDVDQFLSVVRKNFQTELAITDRHFDLRAKLNKSGVSESVEIGHIKPGFHHQPMDAKSKPRKTAALTWICLPYFTSEPYPQRTRTPTLPMHHPELTLLQSRWGKTSRKRELDQVACAEQRSDTCIVVPQTWILLVGNSE